MSLPALRAALPAFTVRPAVATDAEAVTALIAACERELHGVAETELPELRDAWARPGLDLANDTVVVVDGDVIVAYAEVFRGERAEAYVAPDQRGRGIGSALARWWVARAAEAGSTRVGQTVADDDHGARALLESLGCRPAWTAWVLDYDVSQEAEAPPQLPDGYVLRTMQPGEERDVFDVIDRAFSGWEGRLSGQFDDWAVTTVRRTRFESWMAPVVTAGDRIVGAAVLAIFDDEGWVHQIAVAEEHRGRGLGRALLGYAFQAFRGVRASVGLSTDSSTGAIDLYLAVGMRVRRSYTRWSVDL